MKHSGEPRGRRSMTWSALGVLAEILITLAAVCALYLVWQMWWTGVEAEHTQIEVRKSVSWTVPGSDSSDSSSNAGSDNTSDNTSDDSSAGTSANSSASAIAPPQEGEAPVQPESASKGELIAQVYIPRFGQGWVRNVVEGTDESELSLHGLGHYSSTQMPGAVGNFVVAGHRNGYGRPLGDVNLLQPGDAIVVRTQDYWYVYKYTTYRIVTPEHVEAIAANPENPSEAPVKRMITMTTCEPAYSTPTHRWISYGELSYWAKVSDGTPAELGVKSANGNVMFTTETDEQQSPISKLGTLEPVVMWALIVYFVLYIAALVAWRYPVLREIRAGVRPRPDASMYGWLLRHQPGPLIIRWLLLALLLFAVATAIVQWACPWAASNIPVLHSMSNYAVDAG